MRGWVYIIKNKAIQGLIKIGFSTKDPILRAKEFDGTSVPFDFEVIYDALVDDPRIIEQNVHKALKLCDRHYAIERGRVVDQGSSNQQEDILRLMKNIAV